MSGMKLNPKKIKEQLKKNLAKLLRPQQQPRPQWVVVPHRHHKKF